MKDLIYSIKRNEGYRANVYKDHLGFDTIGYGFAIKDLHLSEEVCDAILLEILENLNWKVSKKFSWFSDMPQVIREVIMEMCYQIGISGFSKFKKTIKYFSNKEFAKASTEMLDSKWAREQTPERAKALSKKVLMYANK